MALAKKNRLNLRLNRLRIEGACQKLHSPLFTYLVASQQEPLSQSRFAIVLSKKLAKKAVDRNKIRRNISESIKNSLSKLPQKKDIILIPKKELLDKDKLQISKDLENVLSI
jgi:ribonuclease P protein component